MFKRTFETSATPHITIAECLGDLVARGSDNRRITLRLRDGTDDVVVEREGESLTIAARSDCLLTCPRGTTLTIHVVRGDLKVKEVQGPVVVGTVYGDVTLRGVGPTALEQAHGDLSARQVAGDLQVQSLAGDGRIRGVDGLLSLGQVGGDLRADGLRGGLAAEGIGADVRLGPPFSAGSVYRLNAGSDLRLRLPADASLRLILRTGGRVRSDIPGLDLEEEAGETRGTLGGGEATLEAQVGGHAYLRPLETEEGAAEPLEPDFVADLEGLGLIIETRIAEAMAELETRLEESLGRADSEAVRLRVERATAKARRAAERAAERARMRAERAERRWRRASGQRPRPRREPTTNEERLRVLRLVEEGKITPEQAADLLAALEGR